MVLKAIKWGRLVLVVRGQEGQNYSSEIIWLESTRIRWFAWWPGRRLDQLPSGHSMAVFSQAKAKGDYQARVHSNQMVLTIVWREAGPVARWPKTLKWELENNSRQPKDLTEKRQSNSLKPESAYSFSWEVEEGRCLSWWCWWVRTNHTATGLGDSNSVYWGIMAARPSLGRHTMPTKVREKGGGSGSHQTPVMW
jgi:hypothetical protein